MACITRILLAHNIRFLLDDMCKVTENHHDTCDGSAPMGGGISSKWNNSWICNVTLQMVKVLSSLNAESPQNYCFVGCGAMQFCKPQHVLTARKFNPLWVNMPENSNLQNYEIQTLLLDYIKMLKGFIWSHLSPHCIKLRYHLKKSLESSLIFLKNKGHTSSPISSSLGLAFFRVKREFWKQISTIKM